MKEGDFIVAIGDKDVKWSPHEDVVKLIKDAGDTLSLKLVTPMDRNYLKVRNYQEFMYFKCFNLYKVYCHLADYGEKASSHTFPLLINRIKFRPQHII
jgi:hypothetical protein